jgi:hypothetical protein
LAKPWNYINENISMNFVQHSKSPKSAPLFFVKSYKDYSKSPTSAPLTLCEVLLCKSLILGLLKQLTQIKVITKINLRNVYNLVCFKRKWQVENIIPHKVQPFQIQWHAFCSYECPRIFQHMMNDIFKEFLNDFAIFTWMTSWYFPRTHKNIWKMYIISSTSFKRKGCMQNWKNIFHQSKIEF